MDASGYQIFWGELHDNTYQFDAMPFPFEESLRRARSHLDFYGAAYYTARMATHDVPSGAPSARPQFFLEGWKSHARLQREWRAVLDACRVANEAGRFVTFPGYEWQGNGSSGDHNVFAKHEDLPLVHVDTVAELYDALRNSDAIAIPHHTGYRPGMRGRDWSVCDERLTPFAEIFSCHGCSETDEEWIGLRENAHMGPGVAGGTWQDALNRGLHVGAIGSTDNWGRMPGHYGRGLAACMAPALTRDALWDAFRARHVYAVTGDRIRLAFCVNDAMMGEVIGCGGPRRIEVKVNGCDAIDRIELLRGERVIATHNHQGAWDMPRPGQRSVYRLRIEAGWGPRASEVPSGPHAWRGTVQTDTGRLVGCQPAWISPGQEAAVENPRHGRFGFVTEQEDAHAHRQNAVVWELEGTPETRVRLDLNGHAVDASLAEMAAGSRVLWFRDECMAALEEAAGLASGSPERMDVYYHLAYKAKLHRAMPDAACTAEMRFEDDEPLHGETHYRVRVEQRNGQRAWSSPVWVQPNPV